jgi:hypothetical protein
MRTGKTLILSLVLGVILAVTSTIRSETLSVSDLTEIKYGFPLFWLIHQTVSIVGPVDVWSVQWLMLTGNLIFWYLLSVAIVFVMDKYVK